MFCERPSSPYETRLIEQITTVSGGRLPLYFSTIGRSAATRDRLGGDVMRRDAASHVHAYRRERRKNEGSGY